MKSETRMPASRRRRDDRRAGGCAPPTTSSPPSVVRSSRFSGTRQAACGRMRAARWPTISAVAAISKLSGTKSWRLQALDVVVADVPAVLAQMRGDAVGAGLDRQWAARTGSG